MLECGGLEALLRKFNALFPPPYPLPHWAKPMHVHTHLMKNSYAVLKKTYIISIDYSQGKT